MNCPLPWPFAGLAFSSGSLILYEVLNLCIAIGVSVVTAFGDK
jgi:hypothetical protein